jgi:hypothetical protein
MLNTDPNSLNINKDNPFQVSDGYFAHLPAQVSRKAERAERWKDLMISRTIAASFMLLLAGATAMLMNSNKTHQVKDLTVAANELFIDQAELYGLGFTSSMLDSTVAAFDWELLFDVNMLADTDAEEIAEYLYEQEEFQF